MIECSINNLTKYYGANKIFENISFELKTGDRVGLIGQNGCGKTTLMKILMGAEDYHEGNISYRSGARLGYLDQIYRYTPNTTVIEILEKSFEDIWNLKYRLRTIEDKLKILNGEALETEMKSYGLVLEQYELAGGYEVDTNINKVIKGLMIPDSFKTKPFEKLSGGERTRVLLAKLLLEQPDILLLDEPTNHLDIDSIEWLEGFLSDYKGTVLIVSHDRCFLDKVVSRIIELEPTVVNTYDGNYSDYVVEKERRFELAYKEYIKNQRKIDQMERQIERYRIWGAMRDSEKMYKRAKELEKRLDKIQVLDRPILENSKIRLNNMEIQRTGKIVLKVENVSKSFSDKKLFLDLSFTLFYQDRLCIMGKNGSGKSTFLRILLGEIGPNNGMFSFGANVRIGYLPQNIVFENEEMTILEYFINKHSITQLEARSELAKLLFLKDDVYKKISSLSGGEKSRLKLCSLIFDKVNFMILDEPTNHLDIDSREILEETLINFTGTILFVSHDRYFVRKVATSMMIFDGHHVKLYPMPYDDYSEIKQEETQSLSIEKENKTPKKLSPKPSRKPNNTFKLSKIEEEIEVLEESLKLIDELMTENSDNADKLYQIFQEKEELESKLEELLGTWEKLQR